METVIHPIFGYNTVFQKNNIVGIDCPHARGGRVYVSNTSCLLDDITEFSVSIGGGYKNDSLGWDYDDGCDEPTERRLVCEFDNNAPRRVLIVKTRKILVTNIAIKKIMTESKKWRRNFKIELWDGARRISDDTIGLTRTQLHYLSQNIACAKVIYGYKAHVITDKYNCYHGCGIT